MPTPALYIVMGVSGTGKSTIARALAHATGAIFLDADDFHSPENKAKMAAGLPLTDHDRGPWLDKLNAQLHALALEQKTAFLACSALKQSYRDRLSQGLPRVQFIHLKGSFALIQSRLAHRTGHFMPGTLLESQFADLEEPTGAIVLDVSRTVAQLTDDFLDAIRKAGDSSPPSSFDAAPHPRHP